MVVSSDRLSSFGPFLDLYNKFASNCLCFKTECGNSLHHRRVTQQGQRALSRDLEQRALRVTYISDTFGDKREYGALPQVTDEATLERRPERLCALEHSRKHCKQL